MLLNHYRKKNKEKTAESLLDKTKQKAKKEYSCKYTHTKFTHQNVNFLSTKAEGVIPWISPLMSLVKSSTRPKTGRIPQVCDTHNSKYNDLSSICKSKQQTLSVSGSMEFGLLDLQSSVTIAMAWSYSNT